MIVSAVVDGARGAAGSWRRIALRILLGIACFAPARFAADAAMQKRLAGFPEGGGSGPLLPFESVVDLLGEAGSAYGGMLLAGLIVFLLLDQILTAAATWAADPDRVDRRIGVWRSLWSEGAPHLFPLLRILAVVLVAQAVGLVVVNKLFLALDAHAQREGWTADTRFVSLVELRVLVHGALMATIGAWAFWARILTVADERAIVRRTLTDSLRIFWRAPLSWVGLFVVTTVAVQLFTGWLLVKLSPPVSPALAVVGALAVVVLSAKTWDFLVIAGRRVYRDGPFDDLRARGDQPWDVVGTVRRLLERPRR